MTNQAEHGVPQAWPPVPEADMLDRMLDIISQKAKIDRSALIPGATMESLNIPSLDMIDILFGVEEEFNIYVPMGDELSGVVYLADLVKVLIEQVQENPALREPDA